MQPLPSLIWCYFTKIKVFFVCLEFKITFQSYILKCLKVFRYFVTVDKNFYSIYKLNRPNPKYSL